MSSEQPFHPLFESLGRLPDSHVDSINQPAYHALLDSLAVPLDHAGRCLLLRAPRAGYGKTHLLSRLQHHLSASHEFVPLYPAAGSRVDAASVTDDVLRRFGSPLPAGGGLCGLDVAGRRLFALALQPLVISGEIPCLDREGALSSLRDRPVETFDFHHPNAVTAQWIRDNFELLGPRLAQELANLTGLSPHAAGFWVDALFRFAVTPVEAPGRIDALAQTALSASPGDGAAMERLAALLTLLSLLTRVVLVADDLEVFSADETAALRLAAFICALRQSAERTEVILSLNRDVWDSAFVPRLSSGLLDRLSEVVIELEPLTEAQMVAILDSRAPGFGARVLESMRGDGLEPYARGLLRAAGAAWLRALRQPSAPVVAEPPAPEPPPPAAPQPPPAIPTMEAMPPAASSLSEVKPKAEPTPLWWTPIASEPPPAPPVLDHIAPPETAPVPPDLGNLWAEPPTPPPASGEAAAAPSPVVAEPPATEPVVPIAPFAVPPFGGAPDHPSVAAWHEVTGPTAPFDVHPLPDAPQPQPPAQPPPLQPAADDSPPIDQERVEELLRQFRERYSRPNP
jgi:hypothetical protein